MKQVGGRTILWVTLWTRSFYLNSLLLFSVFSWISCAFGQFLHHSHHTEFSRHCFKYYFLIRLSSTNLKKYNQIIEQTNLIKFLQVVNFYSSAFLQKGRKKRNQCKILCKSRCKSNSVGIFVQFYMAVTRDQTKVFISLSTR